MRLLNSLGFSQFRIQDLLLVQGWIDKSVYQRVKDLSPLKKISELFTEKETHISLTFLASMIPELIKSPDFFAFGH